jgi:hypothetical protein
MPNGVLKLSFLNGRLPRNLLRHPWMVFSPFSGILKRGLTTGYDMLELIDQRLKTAKQACTGVLVMAGSDLHYNLSVFGLTAFEVLDKRYRVILWTGYWTHFFCEPQR